MTVKTIRRILAAAILFLAAAAQAAPPAVIRAGLVRGRDNISALAAAGPEMWGKYPALERIEFVWLEDGEQIDALISGKVDFAASVRASQVIMAASKGADLRIAGISRRPRSPVMPEGTPDDDDELVSAVTGRTAMIRNAAVRAVLLVQDEAAAEAVSHPALLTAPFGISLTEAEKIVSESSLDPLLTEYDYRALGRTQQRLRALGLADDRQLRALIYNRQLRMLIPT